MDGPLATRLEVRAASDLSSAEDEEVARWIDVVFGPQPYEITPVEWRVMLWSGDRLISHVGIARREVQAGEELVLVAGFGWVGTRSEWRGRGLGARVMRRAAGVAREDLKLPFGLLVCGEHNVGFYRQLGWQRVPGPLVFDQPGGKIQWPEAIMILRLGEGAWPPGRIDLRGLLF